MNILLVEDDDLVREALLEVLNDLEGVHVHTATHGAEALEKIKSQQVDLVVTDINMPEVSGLEMVLNMREQGIKTPVILCTAHATKDNVLAALRLQSFDVLEKPFKAQDFLRVVQNAIEHVKKTSRNWMDKLPLSSQQIVILNHLLDHKSNNEIAGLVSLKEPTVKYHIGIILDHFGVKSRTQLKEKVSKMA